MQRSIVKFAQALAGKDDNIQIVQLSTVVSEGLAGNTFDPVAINCPPDILLGNDQPQTCRRPVIMPGQQQNCGTRGLTGGSIEYVLELCRRQ